MKTYAYAHAVTGPDPLIFVTYDDAGKMTEVVMNSGAIDTIGTIAGLRAMSEVLTEVRSQQHFGLESNDGLFPSVIRTQIEDGSLAHAA